MFRESFIKGRGYMKLLRIPVITFLLGLLSGCVSFPQTHDEFRSAAAGTSTFYVMASLQDSYELIAKNTIRCHSGDTNQMSMAAGAFFVFPTDSTRVEGKFDQAAGTAIISINYFNKAVGGGLLQVIDLASTDEGGTKIIVHKLNDTKKWTTATESVESWFQGSMSCFRMM